MPRLHLDAGRDKLYKKGDGCCQHPSPVGQSPDL